MYIKYYMDTNISLHQGVKFNQYQTRIKSRIEKKEGFFKKVAQIKGLVEGFTNVLETTNQNIQNANTQNLQDKLKMQHLGRQFNVLAQRQQTLESSAETSVGQALARYGPQNPYKGQNVRLDEANAMGYVTDLGDFKWYAPDIIANTAGKNGCPAMPDDWTNSPMNITGSISGSNKYNIPGFVLGTSPTLMTGTPMITGQSCGNEGSNVYVNQMITDSSANYIGCYRDLAEGDTDEANRAMIWNPNEIGYTTFDNCKLYAQDHGYKYYAMQDVQSNGIAACLVSNDLTNAIKYGEASTTISKVLWSSGTNGTGVLMQLGAGQINLFQNGTSIFTAGSAWDSNCDSNTNGTFPCQYFLILQDDGNMAIYKGTPSSIEGDAVWASGTNGQQQFPNPNWAASKGQTGANYISFLGSLMPGQWVGSNDGSLMLVMQTDGNLVLYTSTITSGCNAQPYGDAGSQYVNAIYELEGVGNPTLLGKVGYVDRDAVLKEYPGSMLGMSNEYDIYPGMDSVGNDLGAVNLDSLEECQTTCDSIPDCAAFVWETGANICFPKNSGTFPKGSRQVNSVTTLGVRRPSLINDSSCHTDLTNIDTVQYANYVKGDNMTSDTSCSIQLIPEKTKTDLTNVDNNMSQIVGQMTNNLNSLYADNATLNSKMASGEKQLKQNINRYSRVNNQINSELGNTRESMLNMQDLNAMISDTDLVVLQNNYQYVLWTIIALGTVIVTVNALNK